MIPVILCGGAGSRLWPVSRELHPKPFIRLGGHSLLQQAWLRGARLPGVREVIVVTNGKFLHKIEAEVLATGAMTPRNYILEPCGRGTAAAVAASAIMAVERDPASIILVLAADHVIADFDNFSAAVQRARELADQDKIVTFGITPQSAETGYGYIEAEGEVVKRFVEKPDIRTAEEFVLSGRFYWNSGMICCKAHIMLEEMEAHCPAILAAVRGCLAGSSKQAVFNSKRWSLDADGFSSVPADSIDCAVLEKSNRIAMVACDPGWSDVGSWEALGARFQENANGNRIEGNAVLHETSNCHIWSADRIVGAVGVENLVIIDTHDALLVASRERSQDVRHLFARLKASDHSRFAIGPAGPVPESPQAIAGDGEVDVRRVKVNPAGRVSLPVQWDRDSYLLALKGRGNLMVGEAAHAVENGKAIHVPSGSECCVFNTGARDLVMIQVLVDEDDAACTDETDNHKQRKALS